MSTLLLGTNNPGKQAELQALLESSLWELVTPRDLQLDLEIEEDGSTYFENARKKAFAYAEAAGMWSLSDDSGLEVDALDGAPGLKSARLAGGGATDADRRLLLLEMLSNHSRPWIARFRATVVLAGPNGELEHAEGQCPGEIIPLERGSGGFGYDPLFLVQGTEQTMAELSKEQKNRLSHRARAVAALWQTLEQRLKG